MKPFILSLYIKSLLWGSKKVGHINRKIRPQLKKLQQALAQESKETKQMLEIYARQARGEASPAEMAEANQQFSDLLKALGLGIFVLLPFSVITIPFFVKFARHLGIEILPSSFRESTSNNHPVTQNQSHDSN